ncbi:MAG: hypothetical protein ACLQVD_08555, partial [Capsulimonadaceae bacterium]
VMQTIINVVYDGKALWPSYPLELPPNSHFSVTIDSNVQPAKEMPSPEAAVDQETRDIVWQIYDSRLKSLLEPQHNGEIVALDLDTQDYEVAPRSIPAWDALKARRPNGRIVLIDIGPVTEHHLLTRRLNRVIPSSKE